jgi:hypothetical protein
MDLKKFIKIHLLETLFNLYCIDLKERVYGEEKVPALNGNCQIKKRSNSLDCHYKRCHCTTNKKRNTYSSDGELGEGTRGIQY